jgi:hypothetical protein
MPDKKTFDKKGKAKVLETFGKTLDDKSLRILESFIDSGKDLNIILDKAHQFRKYAGL